MKILVIAPLLPRGPGAMPMLLDAQLQALRERHEVTLLTAIGDEPWESPAAQALVGTGADVHVADRRQPRTARLRTRRRIRLASDWAITGRPWTALWLAAPSVQAVLDRLAAQRRFDVVAVEDSAMAVFRLPSSVPAVLTEHEVGRSQQPTSHPHGPRTLPGWAFRQVDWRRWENYQRAAWHRYIRVQVFTEQDAQAMASQAPDIAARVRVNPFGMILPAADDPHREEPGSVLFTGNFTHQPNRDAAAWLVREIMPRVRALSPSARLRLVGSDPPREVRELAGDGVELIANAPDVDTYLERAAVCVAPVRFGGGMRLKVLQALARGKAVVTTTLGAAGYEHPGHELPMLVRDDAPGIATALASVLDDCSRRHELGRRARTFVEEFHSPGAWGARLEAVYEETIAASRL